MEDVFESNEGYQKWITQLATWLKSVLGVVAVFVFGLLWQSLATGSEYYVCLWQAQAEAAAMSPQEAWSQKLQNLQEKGLQKRCLLCCRIVGFVVVQWAKQWSLWKW